MSHIEIWIDHDRDHTEPRAFIVRVRDERDPIGAEPLNDTISYSILDACGPVEEDAIGRALLHPAAEHTVAIDDLIRIETARQMRRAPLRSRAIAHQIGEILADAFTDTGVYSFVSPGPEKNESPLGRCTTRDELKIAIARTVEAFGDLADWQDWTVIRDTEQTA